MSEEQLSGLDSDDETCLGYNHGASSQTDNGKVPDCQIESCYGGLKQSTHSNDTNIIKYLYTPSERTAKKADVPLNGLI